MAKKQLNQEGKIYDRLMRETFGEYGVDMINRLLGKHFVLERELKDNLVSTLDRETDYVAIVRDAADKRLILHVEFQTSDEYMLGRMGEYHALLFRKYQLSIEHVVLYMGQSEADKVKQTQLSEDHVFKGFSLVNLQDFTYREFLASPVSEEKLLAILGDYESKTAEEVIRETLETIMQTTKGEKALSKKVIQLLKLSRLRNLLEITQKQLEAMPIVFDIKEDKLYQQGIAEGERRGEQIGEQKKEREFIVQMLANGLSVKKAAQIAQVSEEYVKQIQRETKST